MIAANHMLTRALLIFIPSTFGVLAYEVVYHKYFRGKQVPLAAGFAVIFLAVVSRLSALFLGMMAAARFVVFGNLKAGRLIVPLGGLLALYVFTILIQAGQNLVRTAIGVPTRPIAWVRSMKPTKGRK